MPTSNSLKRSIRLHCLRLAPGLMAVALMAGCYSARPSARSTPEACAALVQALNNQRSSFVARVKSIRSQHILVLDYDRQMIAALNKRRAELESTALLAMSVNDDVSGCSGEQLSDLRREAHEEMTSLQSFLTTFNRALKEDPAGVYIDLR
jgi:hypothetical protein